MASTAIPRMPSSPATCLRSLSIAERDYLARHSVVLGRDSFRSMVRRLWLAGSMLVTCAAPRVIVEPTDAPTETEPEVTTDTRPACRTFRLDGGVCTGHDDDGDCIPDSCDSCPSIADAPKSG